MLTIVPIPNVPVQIMKTTVTTSILVTNFIKIYMSMINLEKGVVIKHVGTTTEKPKKIDGKGKGMFMVKFS